MKQDPHILVAQVPKCWCIARDPFSDRICTHARSAFRPQSDTAFSNAQGQAISARKIMVVTRAATDILVSRQYLIVKKKLSQLCLRGIGRHVIFGLDLRMHWRSEEPEKMYKTIGAICLCAAVTAVPAAADMENARDLMEAGEFQAAKELFEIYARSGNADAEELIGVMYALGLGVERDDIRAFDWYLRASLKGHAGAQSGLGWYYEVGRGLPAPDLVRAYLWYALSAIGGDVDAPDSLESLTPKLTEEELAQAEKMVDDYRVWMYPFR